MKKYFLIFCLAALAANAQNNTIDEVIWVVGDDAILKSNVEEQIARTKYEGTKVEGDLECIIPEEIAIQKLLLHQAKIDSITETSGSINQQVEQRIDYFVSQIGSKEKMEAYFGKSTAALKEELREVIEQQSVAQKMQQKIVGDIKITPTEVRNFFTALPQSEIPTIPAKSEVQIITIESKAPEQEIEEIKNKLRDFKERVENGSASFSTLATLYSEDDGTRRNGGELGFTGRGMLVPEFATVAFNLTDPKRVSPIVETEYGFHIIQLIERRGDKINVRHILLKPQTSLAERQNSLKKLDSIADNIRSGKQTFEEAVMRYSGDKNTRLNAGLMSNQKSGDSKFQDQDLPPEILRVVGTMNIGELSKPFIMRNASGKEVCAIAKVKSKTKSHTANLNDDYTEIKEALQAQKGKEAFDKWLANKQKETYISIKDRWKTCEFRYPGWVK
ncbi:MAG: peptidylprolyl isomerase [Prevotellaceae bacterium]|jgi:peptidyl-prolyl cis-trans isomerase SurA|nr:peptidylprolyl isomerase [Prevotellaceae bacterium]